MDILGTLRRLAGNRLTQKQKLVLCKISALDSEMTMSTLLRQIAHEENMGESTARLVLQNLRDIGLIECGRNGNKGVPVCLTPVGEVLVQHSERKSIGGLRDKIDLVDSLLLDLIAERMEIAKDIGEIKQKNGLKVKDAKREKLVKVQWLETAKVLKIDPMIMRRVLRNIMLMSKEVQK